MRGQKNQWLFLYMALLVLGFFGTVVFSLTYMAKDYNLYNMVYEFFNVSVPLRRAMTEAPISKAMLLRLLNASHVLFYFSSFQYVLYITRIIPQRMQRRLKTGVGVVGLLQLFFFDPGIIALLYMRRVAFFADVVFFRQFYDVLTGLFNKLAIAVFLASFVLLVWAFFRTPRAMRLNLGLAMLLFTGLLCVYLYLFRWLPVQVLWMSRVAAYVGFESLPVYKPTGFNALMPSLSVVLILGLSVVTAYYVWVFASEQHSLRVFSRKINEMDTVSRVFCHYLKNQLLAQQAELRLLQLSAPEDMQQPLALVIERNDEVFHYLERVRDTFRQKKLPFDRVDLCGLVQQVLNNQGAWKGTPVKHTLPETPLFVRGNVYQLESVLLALIQNAMEAPRGKKPLRFKVTLSTLRDYACITIANNAQRIDRRKRKMVFQPFYSTKPTGTNWGLGLSLCKSIVLLHHGRIDLEEETDEGEVLTCFRLLLPLTVEEESTGA